MQFGAPSLPVGLHPRVQMTIFEVVCSVVMLWYPRSSTFSFGLTAFTKMSILAYFQAPALSGHDPGPAARLGGLREVLLSNLAFCGGFYTSVSETSAGDFWGV